MSTRIPTSTSITESAVIDAPLSAVWHLIKLQSFPQFWSKLAKAEAVKAKSVNDEMQKSTDTLKQEMQRNTGAHQ